MPQTLPDGVVARAEQCGHQAEDRLLGTGEREDIIGREVLVQLGNLGSQERVAGRLRVAELQAVPHRSRLIVGELEQIGHRPAFDVRRAEQVLDRELPAGEETLEFEIGDAHDRDHDR